MAVFIDMKANKDKDKIYLSLIESGRIKTDPEKGVVYSCKYGKEIPIGSVSPLGYVVTSVNSNKYIMVHRIIWMSVHGAIPDNLEINHINGVKTDNRIDNLELVTRAQNIIHARNILGKVIGVFGRTFAGGENGNAKLNEGKVDDIRYLYFTGRYSQNDIARMYNMSQAHIGEIVRGDRWKPK